MRALRVAVAALALLLAAGFATQVVASPVGAQQTSVDIGDFTDPVTGVIDFDAYLAALNAQLTQGGAGDEGASPVTPSGALPYTGSSVSDFVVVGLGAVVLGGAAYAAAQRQRKRSTVS